MNGSRNNRRRFLTSTAAAGVSLVGVPAMAKSRASAAERIRVAVVGRRL